MGGDDNDSATQLGEQHHQHHHHHQNHQHHQHHQQYSALNITSWLSIILYLNSIALNEKPIQNPLGFLRRVSLMFWWNTLTYVHLWWPCSIKFPFFQANRLSLWGLHLPLVSRWEPNIVTWSTCSQRSLIHRLVRSNLFRLKSILRLRLWPRPLDMCQAAMSTLPSLLDWSLVQRWILEISLKVETFTPCLFSRLVSWRASPTSWCNPLVA